MSKVGDGRSGYFSLAERDPHHWDVSNGETRIFAVRGVPGAIFIRDERVGNVPNIGPFQTSLAAATWIADVLMFERPKSQGECK